MTREMGYNQVAIGLHVLLDLMAHVFAEIYCRQEQLGSTVVIRCPPQNKLLLSYCCNDNGKIACCSYEDFMNRERGQSVEAITLLAVAGFFTVLIVTALCYISWHGKFSKSNAATLPKNKHQDNSSPKQNVQRTIPTGRYAEVLKSILSEDQKEVISPTKEGKK